MSKDKKNLGDAGEKFAVQYMLNIGHEILDKNVCLWGGQIDLITEINHEIHFIEVKTRTKLENITLLSLISNDQIQTLLRSAKRYLFFNDKEERNWQIDLLFIVINRDTIKHLELFEDITF